MMMDEVVTGKEKISLFQSFADQADGIDLSWSIFGATAERRIALYFRPTPGLIVRLTRFAALLGLSAAALDTWRRDCAGADAIGLAVSADFGSVRLYTQHLEAHLPAVEAGDLRPFPIYRGVKALGGERTRVDEYVCTPLAERETFMPALVAALGAQGLSAAEIARSFAALAPENTIFAQIDGAGRQSWIVTLREAGLSQPEIARLLAPIGAATGDARLSDCIARCELVHVAGGTDPIKGEFLTLYFEALPADVARILQDGLLLHAAG